MSCSRESTRPAARASAASSSNSWWVRTTRRPLTVTSRASKSIDQATGGEARAARRRHAAAEHRADARQQLARVEGLGQVVVGAELEADDLVDVLAPRREHQDRQRRPLGRRPDAATDLQAVDAGQHHVEQDDVEAAAAQRGQAALAVGGDGDLELVLAEVLGHHRAQTGVVLDEEHGRMARGHAATLPASLRDPPLSVRARTVRTDPVGHGAPLDGIQDVVHLADGLRDGVGHLLVLGFMLGGERRELGGIERVRLEQRQGLRHVLRRASAAAPPSRRTRDRARRRSSRAARVSPEPAPGPRRSWPRPRASSCRARGPCAPGQTPPLPRPGPRPPPPPMPESCVDSTCRPPCEPVGPASVRRMRGRCQARVCRL